jgi:hypothetical protein
MSDLSNIPGSHSAPLDERGNWRAEWYRFLRGLATQPGVASNIAAQITALAGRVSALESESDLLAQFNGIASVQVTGSLAAGVINITLVGDEDAPAASYYYGTDASGAKGWHELSLDALSDVDLITPPVAGDTLVYDGSAWIPGTVDAAVPFFVPDGETFTVAANKQALFTLPIELDGDASLVLDGALVEVS